VVLPWEALAQGNVDQDLRVELEIAEQLLQASSRFTQRGKNLQRRDDAVAGRVPVETKDMARVLATVQPSLLAQRPSRSDRRRRFEQTVS
jgi:hypothetical protein